MPKKKGAVAAKARAKREARQGVVAAAAVPTGPIVHANGRRVHRGLMNLGNTCFMNSVVQCLNVSLPFSDDLLRIAAEGLDGLAGSLCTVLRGIRATDDTPGGLQKFSPKAFHLELVSTFPWYEGKAQQDAHEFLRSVLGAISDQRSDAERREIEEALEDGKLLPDLDQQGSCGRSIQEHFQGHMFAATLCWSCGGVTTRLDPFLDLSLDLPMHAGTRRMPLGLRVATVAGVPEQPLEEEEEEEEEAPLEEGSENTDSQAAGKAAGPLLGRWAANRSAEALAAIREHVPGLVERIVMAALVRSDASLAKPPAEEGTSVEISLTRASKKAVPRWGFRWNDAALQKKSFVVGGIREDSAVDKWNLKRMSAGSAELAVYVGDRIAELNGEADFEGIQKRLKHDNTLELRLVRSSGGETSGPLHDETDDEAEEARLTMLAAQEERRKEFCEQAKQCFERLPAPLQRIFGEAQTSRRIVNGRLLLQDCIEHSLMVDAMEDDYSASYSCAACRMSDTSKKVFASRRYWLLSTGLPPTLVLHLKRFRQYSDYFVKSSTKVTLPDTLDLSDYTLKQANLESLRAHSATAEKGELLPHEMLACGHCDPVEKGDAAQPCYELFAICEHQGRMEDGHYVAYVNSGPSLEREEWFGVSDAKLWHCTRSEVLQAEAYIAFYRQMGLSTAAPEAPNEEPVN